MDTLFKLEHSLGTSQHADQLHVSVLTFTLLGGGIWGNRPATAVFTEDPALIPSTYIS